LLQGKRSLSKELLEIKLQILEIYEFFFDMRLDYRLTEKVGEFFYLNLAPLQL